MSSRRSESGGTFITMTARRWKRSSRKVPFSISLWRFLLVAAITLTSTVMSLSLPTLDNLCSCSTRSTFACAASDMEKKAEAGKPTVFTFDFTYTETDRWYGFDESAVKPYVTAPSTNASGNDAGSSARTASAVAAREASAAIYREYTAERAPHIVFSPRIRRLADSLTAGIDNLP